MPKSTAYCSALLDLELNAIPIAGIADDAGTYTYLEVALHTADPGAGGVQTTNEVAYTGYARAQVARDPNSPKWTGSGASRSNAEVIAWPKCTAAPTTATYASLGRNGLIMYRR